MRLLKAIDEAADDPTGQLGELSEFEWIVRYGVAELPGRVSACRAWLPALVIAGRRP